ncbi:protein of unknown function [Methylocaldum szegediense]|uniref:Uncharacterized protein n=1 Tax=Methylocaldum szegediense TaxID=73780 RepID=A0ABM9HVV2_9GAMM|nr:protein of unknown function [Methylocaldum szegediense]
MPFTARRIEKRHIDITHIEGMAFAVKRIRHLIHWSLGGLCFLN